MAYTPTDNPYIPGDPYSYDLKWIVAKIKEALTGIEGLTTGQSDLSNDFEALREYVYNYFDNLDISQEVDDKINELYADGFFDDIIEEWMNGHIKWTNPNLLDNGWFFVNQRGQTEYTQVAQSYNGPDRWRWLSGNTGKITMNSPYGITIWQSDTSRGNAWLVQRMANSEALYGKTLTISVNIDGTIYSYTGTCPSTVTSSEQLFVYKDPTPGIYVRLGLQTTGFVQADIAAYTNTAHTINAVKVELGTYSTLANDTPPDTAQELLKCQRYFLRVTGSNSLIIAYGMTFGNGANLRALIPTPATMRSTPSISRGGTIYVRGEGGLLSLSDLTVIAVQSNGIVVDATSPSAYAGNAVYGLWGEIGSYINLSADL